MPPATPRHRAPPPAAASPPGCGAPVPASSGSALEQRLVERAQQLLDPGHLVGLVDRGAEFGGAGQPFRIPAEMLAGYAQAGLGAVMAQHLIVMTQHDLVLDRERRGGV